MPEEEFEMISNITRGVEHMFYITNNDISTCQAILIISIKKKIEDLALADQSNPNVIAASAYFKSLLSKVEKATDILPFT